VGRSPILRLLARGLAQTAPNAEDKILTLLVSGFEGLGEVLLDLSSPDDLDEWLRLHIVSAGKSHS
jgi:Domain of unknown function (DUF4351)